MFAADYFQGQLRRNAESMAGAPVVEIYLVNGHSHRVRSIVEVTPGFVTLDVYQVKGDRSQQQPRWDDESVAAQGSALETMRTSIAYDSITEVRFEPSTVHVRAQAGFGSF
ncbi:MAG TPA: hypothetical protein VHQ45_12835 [Gemmatimonadaceae bacterium]|jgi:hypothetical protein|nr:hypothetical protein [Gemmatimonadaceae bacterium]